MIKEVNSSWKIAEKLQEKEKRSFYSKAKSIYGYLSPEEQYVCAKIKIKWNKKCLNCKTNGMLI